MFIGVLLYSYDIMTLPFLRQPKNITYAFQEMSFQYCSGG